MENKEHETQIELVTEVMVIHSLQKMMVNWGVF